MLLFVQNVSTSITIGPVVTSAGIITSGMTTAASIVYQNGGLATTLSLTSVVYKTGGIYQIDLSSAALANVGRVIINVVSNTGYNGGGPIYGGVMPSTNQAFFYNATYIPAILSSYNWNSETSRLLSSAAAAATAVWAAATRNLTSFGVTLGADIWAVTTRNLSSFGVTLGADVWAATTRLLSSAAVVWAETARLLTSGQAVANDVWANTSRTLTSTPVSTWGASDVWTYSARTLTSAAAIWTETTRIVTGVPVSTWGPSDVWAYTPKVLTSAGVVWSDLLETTLTYKQGMQGLVAVNLGQSTGGGTTAVSFQNIGSTVTRAAYTVTSVGNRSAPVFSW